MKREFILLMLCIGFISSCNSSQEIEIPEEIAAMESVALFSSDDEPLHNIEFERVASYGDTDDMFIGQLRGAGVDDDGRVYLADGSEMLVHIYEPDGTHIQSIGGKGEGPGEFSAVNQPLLYNNHMYVIDYMQRRVSAFKLDDFTFDYAINIGDNDSGMMGFPEQFIPLTSGNYFIVMNSMNGNNGEYSRKPALFLVDENGDVVEKEMISFEDEKVVTIQSGSSFMLLIPPYNPRTIVRSNNSEEIVSANNDRMFIQFYDMEGNYKRGVYYSHPKVPLDRNKIIDNYEGEEMKSALRKETMPETMPVFNQFHLDDEDRMWFSIITEEEDQQEYWLLDRDGERLASFTWSDRKRIQAIRNNHIYTQEEDDMGLHEIVKYRIQLD